MRKSILKHRRRRYLYKTVRRPDHLRNVLSKDVLGRLVLMQETNITKLNLEYISVSMEQSRATSYYLPSHSFTYESVQIELAVLVECGYNEDYISYTLIADVCHDDILSTLQFKHIDPCYHRGDHVDNDICYYVVNGLWEEDVVNSRIGSIKGVGNVSFLPSYYDDQKSEDSARWRIGEYVNGNRFIKYGTKWSINCTRYSAKLIGAIMDEFEIIIKKPRARNA